jgi:hypothetical protein
MILERPKLPREIYGLNFSGAADAGKIRIASGVVENGVLLIESCLRTSGSSEGRTGRDPSVSQHVPDDVCRCRTGFSRCNPPQELGRGQRGSA